MPIDDKLEKVLDAYEQDAVPVSIVKVQPLHSRGMPFERRRQYGKSTVFLALWNFFDNHSRVNLHPAVTALRVMHVAASDLDVLPGAWLLHATDKVLTCVLRTVLTNLMFTDGLNYQIAMLTAYVRWIEQTLLSGVQLQTDVVIAIWLTAYGFDFASDDPALLFHIQAVGIVYMLPFFRKVRRTISGYVGPVSGRRRSGR
jgi:hypothetical protein